MQHNLKISKGYERTFIQNSHKENANQNYKILLYTHQNINKKWKILIIGEDVEKFEPLYTTDGNGKMVQPFGKQSDSSSKTVW